MTTTGPITPEDRYSDARDGSERLLTALMRYNARLSLREIACARLEQDRSWRQRIVGAPYARNRDAQIKRRGRG